MPWISQMLGFALLCLGIAFALWVSFWLLLVLFGLGLLAVVWTHLRDFLLAKGILNPRPGRPMEDVTQENEVTITVIDGDYKRVDSE
jgi:hypothetical protein